MREESDVSEAEVEPERPAQRRRVSDDDNGEASFGNDMDGETQSDSTQEQMVKNLVRLALACEYTRAPIRRSDITAKVLGSHSRQFKPVFAAAQQRLRQVFGMEMKELPLRDKITVRQKRAAAKSQSQQKSSNAWILTTALPAIFRTPEILQPSNAPTTEIESQYTALSSFIVSCIMLSGGSINETKLDRHLTRANVHEHTPFTSTIMLSALDKTEKLLKKMEKDGFIVKVKDTSGGDEVVEYIVGPRGKVEIGDEGVEGMVRAVYGEVDNPADLDRRLKRSLGVAQSNLGGEATESAA